MRTHRIIQVGLIIGLFASLWLAALQPVHASSVIFVVSGGTGTHSGSSWADAKDLV